MSRTGGGRPVVEVQGLRTLRRTLKEAGHSLDHEFRDAHKAVADIVVRAARPRTPVGPDAGGHMRDDIRGAGQAAAAVVRVGRASRPYPGVIHWGWPARHIPAQPWLYDAAVASQQQWTGTYLSALEKIIDAVEGTPGP
jgi:hypothetical protein